MTPSFLVQLGCFNSVYVSKTVTYLDDMLKALEVLLAMVVVMPGLVMTLPWVCSLALVTLLRVSHLGQSAHVF